jgi:hypothetical protein
MLQNALLFTVPSNYTVINANDQCKHLATFMMFVTLEGCKETMTSPCEYDVITTMFNSCRPCCFSGRKSKVNVILYVLLG